MLLPLLQTQSRNPFSSHSFWLFLCWLFLFSFWLFSSKNFHIDNSDISLPAFPCQIYLKLYDILVTPMLVKVITHLESAKAPGPDCIPVVVPKNFEPELWYIAYLIFSIVNICVKKSCFPVFLVCLLWPLCLKTLGRG